MPRWQKIGRRKNGPRKQVQVWLHQHCPLRGLALLCPRGDIPSTGKTDQAALGGQQGYRQVPKKQLHIAGEHERPLLQAYLPSLWSPKTNLKFFLLSRTQGTLFFMYLFIKDERFKSPHYQPTVHKDIALVSYQPLEPKSKTPRCQK